ncbi:MAG: hypothetical protein K0R61_2472 [Microvirga sp.]|nr:hypothetical protein [Microvirga sp.]
MITSRRRARLNRACLSSGNSKVSIGLQEFVEGEEQGALSWNDGHDPSLGRQLVLRRLEASPLKLEVVSGHDRRRGFAFFKRHGFGLQFPDLRHKLEVFRIDGDALARPVGQGHLPRCDTNVGFDLQIRLGQGELARMGSLICQAHNQDIQLPLIERLHQSVGGAGDDAGFSAQALSPLGHEGRLHAVDPPILDDGPGRVVRNADLHLPACPDLLQGIRIVLRKVAAAADRENSNQGRGNRHTHDAPEQLMFSLNSGTHDSFRTCESRLRVGLLGVGSSQSPGRQDAA